VLTLGQRPDVTQAEVLQVADRPEVVVADRRYDTDWLVARVEAPGANVVIPPMRNRIEQPAYDRNLYADRNKVECSIGRIKHYRRSPRALREGGDQPSRDDTGGRHHEVTTPIVHETHNPSSTPQHMRNSLFDSVLSLSSKRRSL